MGLGANQNAHARPLADQGHPIRGVKLAGGHRQEGGTIGLHAHKITYRLGLSTTFLGRPPFLPLALDDASLALDVRFPSSDMAAEMMESGLFMAGTYLADR